VKLTVRNSLDCQLARLRDEREREPTRFPTLAGAGAGRPLLLWRRRIQFVRGWPSLDRDVVRARGSLADGIVASHLRTVIVSGLCRDRGPSFEATSGLA
jgi:hypothetical protein